MKLPKRIPKRFWPYFWDVDTKKFDPVEKPLFVIQRLLDWNNFSAARWVVNNFSKKEIIRSLTGLRGWSKKSLSFWKAYFKLPAKPLWNRPESRPQPVSHWNY